jgi:hypothetical protein
MDKREFRLLVAVALLILLLQIIAAIFDLDLPFSMDFPGARTTPGGGS